MLDKNIDIDLVCCWVDIDEEYGDSLIAHAHHAKHGQALNKGRFRQLGELKYSIPLVRKNIPWVKNIFIVTNGQKPPQEVLEIEGVIHVTHDEIFIKKEFLPTFNYHAIEPNLVNIPGLSENFILTSDDFFVTKPVELESFIGGAQAGVYRFTRKCIDDFVSPENIWQKNLKASNDALDSYFGDYERFVFPHAPQIFSKTHWYEALDVFKTVLEKTMTEKFRSETDVIFRLLYSYMAIYRRWGKADLTDIVGLSNGDVNFFNMKEYQTIALVAPGKGLWESKLNGFANGLPTYLCLNDNIPENKYEEAQAIVVSFLKLIFCK